MKKFRVSKVYQASMAINRPSYNSSRLFYNSRNLYRFPKDYQGQSRIIRSEYSKLFDEYTSIFSKDYRSSHDNQNSCYQSSKVENRPTISFNGANFGLLCKNSMLFVLIWFYENENKNYREWKLFLANYYLCCS